MQMQDQYFGDVGDYAKYKLLRYIVKTKLRLGVHWYLTPNRLGNASDGRHIQYLEQPDLYRKYDSELFDLLHDRVHDGRRCVCEIESSGLVPASYWSVALNYTCTNIAERRVLRQTWHENALKATKDAEVVFVDPDNGLEVQAGPHTLKGPKYAYYDELNAFWGRNQSLLIYQHLGRKGGTHLQQIEIRKAEIEQQLKQCKVFALHARRGSARAFFFVAQAAHKDDLLSAAGEAVKLGGERRLYEPKLL